MKEWDIGNDNPQIIFKKITVYGESDMSQEKEDYIIGVMKMAAEKIDKLDKENKKYAVRASER